LVEALRDSQQRYQVLFDSTRDFVAELDDEGRVLFVSPSCEAILGYEPRDLVGTTPFALLHADDVERLADSFLRRVAAAAPAGPGSVFRARGRGGAWRWPQAHRAGYATSGGRRPRLRVRRGVTPEVRGAGARRALAA